MLSPQEITSKSFNKTFGMGYRMDEVDSFLEQVSSSMSQLLEENEDLEAKLLKLAEKLEEYREDEESLRTALLGAQKLGDSVIRESKTKAEIVLRDATIKAEAMISNAKRQIDREQESLVKLREEVASFKNRLITLYKQHIELINTLPGELEEEPEGEAASQPETVAQATAADEVEEQVEITSSSEEIEPDEEPSPFDDID